LKQPADDVFHVLILLSGALSFPLGYLERDLSRRADDADGVGVDVVPRDVPKEQDDFVRLVNTATQPGTWATLPGSFAMTQSFEYVWPVQAIDASVFVHAQSNPGILQPRNH
jgi:hypothetical protein